jgi:hypothetical protein
MVMDSRHFLSESLADESVPECPDITNAYIVGKLGESYDPLKECLADGMKISSVGSHFQPAISHTPHTPVV